MTDGCVAEVRDLDVAAQRDVLSPTEPLTSGMTVATHTGA